MKAAEESSQEQPPSGAELIIYTPSGNVLMRCPLVEDELIIGRDPASDIRLEGHKVSRTHAKIVRTKAGHRIVDQNSTNGIRRGGVRAESWDLSFGDEVEIAGYRVTYVMSGSDPDMTARESSPSPTKFTLRVDDRSGQALIGEQPIDPPPSKMEFKLLSYLYARRDELCTREELGGAIWGEGLFEDVMVHQLVHRLRVRLGDDPNEPRYVINVQGQGYRLDPTGRGSGSSTSS